MNKVLEETIRKVQHVEKLLAIKGVGSVTIAGFIAEVGDMIPLLARNKEFRTIYDYYVTRVKNPLKRRQAMIAVSCKLIRVFYAVLTKGVDYDRFKIMSDIHHERGVIAA